jgi:hypothetical protein
MRKALVLLLLVSLLLWSPVVFAFSRPIARRCDGDPDEFQSRPIRHEFDTRVVCPTNSRIGRNEITRWAELERERRNLKTRIVIINFSGRILLEK